MSTKDLACWQAAPEIDEAIENEAEGTPPAKLELSPALAADMLAKRVSYWDAELAAHEARYADIIAQYEDGKRFIEKRKEAAKRLIMSVFPPSHDADLVTDHVRLFYTESERLQIVNEELIPIEYVTKHEPVYDTAAIKNALKSAKEVPGCVLECRFNLQIKPGGLRGKENAKQRAKRGKTPKMVEAE